MTMPLTPAEQHVDHVLDSCLGFYANKTCIET